MDREPLALHRMNICRFIESFLPESINMQVKSGITILQKKNGCWMEHR